MSTNQDVKINDGGTQMETCVDEIDDDSRTPSITLDDIVLVRREAEKTAIKPVQIDGEKYLVLRFKI